jgi:hypothetical protein
MLFMIIERFKGRDAAPVYARLRGQGRTLPDGLRYMDSWVEGNFDRCFQLMECDDVTLLQRWVLQWRDLVEFEIVLVHAEPCGVGGSAQGPGGGQVACQPGAGSQLAETASQASLSASAGEEGDPESLAQQAARLQAASPTHETFVGNYPHSAN